MTDERRSLSFLENEGELELVLNNPIINGRAEIFWVPFTEQVWLKTFRDDTKNLHTIIPTKTDRLVWHQAQL
jgi:hypothetical protein